MTESRENNNQHRVNMKNWRAIAAFNVFIGSTVLIIQIATLSSLYDWVDWIGIGIWGGCFMISAGSLTIQRSPRLMSMAICALLSGFALIIFYAWNLAVVNTTYYCISYYNYNYELCEWRKAADIIFIVCGCLAVVINMLLTANASKIMLVRPTVRYPITVNAYPMTATNTTYVVTRPATYPTQTVYQVPVATYPTTTTTGVVFQTTSPGYPASPQQQQPVFYPPPNPPPAYTATAVTY